MDPIKTSWQWQHELIEAAQERGWLVTAIDVRGSVTLEEPRAAGVTMHLTSRINLTSEFIRSLPEARMPDERPS